MTSTPVETISSGPVTNVPMEPTIENSKPEKGTSEREQCLRTATQYVTKDRNATHGDPEDNFQNIADLWSILLKDCVDPEDIRLFIVRPHHVAMAMAAVKLARLISTPGNFDNWVDLAGYAACGWEAAVKENRRD